MEQVTGPVDIEATKARLEELQKDKARERKRHPKKGWVPWYLSGGNRDPIPSTEEVPLKPGGNRAKKKKANLHRRKLW